MFYRHNVLPPMLFPFPNCCRISRRGVTIKQFAPRPYKRRLYEAALSPILPKRLERRWREANDPFNAYSASPSADSHEKGMTKYELALVEKLRNWIKNEKFRVMAICQFNSTKEETLWLAKNQFRLNGVEFCDFPSKILRKLFESTQFRTINTLLLDECTCLLIGRGPECIGTVHSLCGRFNWIQPIAYSVDNRILTLEHAAEFVDADSENRLRTQTVQIAAQILAQIPRTFDAFTAEMPLLLDTHLKKAAG